ncbi:hypothetical protein T4D_17169 [Trichinella pseudospiralis]|uniref:Uncharacterized protein n=1 Tax=Trichinella pseudospiralis TaxID=6337 RepID=A0A0V1FWP0_TRIPS|nr:hypothetical protein T4D_17169 [Trichinella pseudospiralis]
MPFVENSGVYLTKFIESYSIPFLPHPKNELRFIEVEINQIFHQERKCSQTFGHRVDNTKKVNVQDSNFKM